MDAMIEEDLEFLKTKPSFDCLLKTQPEWSKLRVFIRPYTVLSFECNLRLLLPCFVVCILLKYIL